MPSNAERAEAVGKCFRSWDDAGQGVISFRSLCQVLRHLGLGEEVANTFIADAHCISYGVFVDWAFGMKAPTGLGLSSVFDTGKDQMKGRRAQPSQAGFFGRGHDLEVIDGADEESVEMLDAEFEAMRAELGGIAEDESTWDLTLRPEAVAIGLARSQSSDQTAHSTYRARDLLTASHGPRGLKTLSLSASAHAFAKTLGCSGMNTLTATLSAADALHGKFTWVRGEPLGAGSMGSVFKALNQSDGTIIAVKEVGIDEGKADDMRFRKELEHEISIIEKLRHPRIVSFFGSDCLDGNLYVYLEYMPGGSLAQVLRDFGALDESLCASYTRDIVEGLEYLHSRAPPVLHRDIKGANILVSLDCTVKLTDFGCSKRTDDSKSTTMRGSIPWMAPEVVMKSGAGRPADIWSLGCVVIEMATGKLPWGGFDNHMAAMRKIGMSKQEVPIPDFFSVAGQDFMRLCVQRDQRKRPSAADLLKHEFVGALLLRNISDF